VKKLKKEGKIRKKYTDNSKKKDTFSRKQKKCYGIEKICEN